MKNLDVLFNNWSESYKMTLAENKALNEIEKVVNVNDDDVMSAIVNYVAESQRTAFNGAFKMAYKLFNELEESDALTYKGKLTDDEIQEIERIHKLIKMCDINEILENKIDSKIIELCLHDSDAPMLNAIEVYNLGVMRGKQQERNKHHK